MLEAQNLKTRQENNCPASICRTLEKFHVTIWTMALISHCANIDLINRKEKMEDSILKLITIGYALGIAIVGIMAYLGIKGTNEAIDYQNEKYIEEREKSRNFKIVDKLEKRISTLEKI